MAHGRTGAATDDVMCCLVLYGACSVRLGKLQEAGSADGARRRPRTTGRPVRVQVQWHLRCATMTIKCNTVTQHWDPSLPIWAVTHFVEPARSRLVLSHAHTIRKPIALPKDLTCGLQSTTRSVPTSSSARPPGGRYRRSVVEERGEVRAAQPSAMSGGGPLAVCTFAMYQTWLPILAMAMATSQFYPKGTYPPIS